MGVTDIRVTTIRVTAIGVTAIGVTAIPLSSEICLRQAFIAKEYVFA
jgi:hypothetical protein